jgi:hypothetical protein
MQPLFMARVGTHRSNRAAKIAQFRDGAESSAEQNNFHAQAHGSRTEGQFEVDQELLEGRHVFALLCAFAVRCPE